MGGRRNNYAGWDSRAGAGGNAFHGRTEQNLSKGQAHQPFHRGNQSAGGAFGTAHQQSVRQHNAFAASAPVTQAWHVGKANAFAEPRQASAAEAPVAFASSVQSRNAFVTDGHTIVTNASGAFRHGGQAFAVQSTFPSPSRRPNAFSQNASSVHRATPVSGWPAAQLSQQRSPMMNNSQSHIANASAHPGGLVSSCAFSSPRPAQQRTVNAFSRPGMPAPEQASNAFTSQLQLGGGAFPTQTAVGFGRRAFSDLPNAFCASMQGSQQTLLGQHAVAPGTSPQLTTSVAESVAEGELSLTTDEWSMWNTPAFLIGKIPEIAPPPEVCF